MRFLSQPTDGKSILEAIRLQKETSQEAGHNEEALLETFFLILNLDYNFACILGITVSLISGLVMEQKPVLIFTCL